MATIPVRGTVDELFSAKLKVHRSVVVAKYLIANTRHQAV
jgi:hypothetical protein